MAPHLVDIAQDLSGHTFTVDQENFRGSNNSNIAHVNFVYRKQTKRWDHSVVYRTLCERRSMVEGHGLVAGDFGAFTKITIILSGEVDIPGNAFAHRGRKESKKKPKLD
jgi:hypothetical protein